MSDQHWDRRARIADQRLGRRPGPGGAAADRGRADDTGVELSVAPVVATGGGDPVGVHLQRTGAAPANGALDERVLRRLTATVLGLAASRVASWSGRVPGLTGAVALDGPHWHDPDLATLITRAATAAGLDRHRLRLDLPEHLLGVDPGALAEALGRMADAGVPVGLLGYRARALGPDELARLGVAAVVVDAGVLDAAPEPGPAERLRRLIDGARHAGLQVTAAGATTAAALHELAAMGAELLSGPAVGASRPAAAVTDVRDLVADPER
jgi:EAL domain-containing protein (putative c-di-GMP-specific phosphodiesterase class I)